jgi:hypothetical protein
MKDLDKKLKNLEDEIVENRLQKKQRRKRIDKRDSLIHQKYIRIWNDKIAKNKEFKFNLDKIISHFKKINPKNNRYYWMLQEDISMKERVKSIVLVYVNNDRLSMELRLYGNSTEIVCTTETEIYPIKNIEKAKNDFINIVLEIFKEQIDSNEY